MGPKRGRNSISIRKIRYFIVWTIFSSMAIKAATGIIGEAIINDSLSKKIVVTGMTLSESTVHLPNMLYILIVASAPISLALIIPLGNNFDRVFFLLNIFYSYYLIYYYGKVFSVLPLAVIVIATYSIIVIIISILLLRSSKKNSKSETIKITFSK